MSYTYHAYGLTIRVPFACPALTPPDAGSAVAAVDVIDEQGLYLLGHVCSVSLVEL